MYKTIYEVYSSVGFEIDEKPSSVAAIEGNRKNGYVDGCIIYCSYILQRYKIKIGKDFYEALKKMCGKPRIRWKISGIVFALEGLIFSLNPTWYRFKKWIAQLTEFDMIYQRYIRERHQIIDLCQLHLWLKYM